MSVKNTTLFTVTGGLTEKPVTFLVETVKPLGEETVVALESLEGEYETREEFEDALDYTVKMGKGLHTQGRDEEMEINIPEDTRGAKTRSCS